MADIIQVDYEKLRKVASDFSGGYDRSRQVHMRLDQQIHQLKSGGWIADAGFRYYDSMDNDVMVGIQKLAVAMQSADSTIIAIIRIFAQFDEEAAACLQGMGESGGIAGFIETLQGAGGSVLATIASVFSTQDLNGGFRSPTALVSLISGGLVDNEILKETINFFNHGFQNGFTPESVAEFFVGIGVNKGFEALLSSGLKLGSKAAIIPLISDAIQFVGGADHDASIIVRNLLTGGDSSLLSYSTMTNSINEFAGVLDDVNLSGVLGDFSKVVVDVGIDPIFHRFEAAFNDPSFGNIMGAITSTNPMNMGTNFVNDLVTMPEFRTEVLQNTFRFGGSTLDFVTGVPRLATAFNEHHFNMGVGISQNIIERLPLDPGTQQTLLDYSTSIQNHTNSFMQTTSFITNPGMGMLSQINRNIDFSQTFEGFATTVSGWFD